MNRNKAHRLLKRGPEGIKEWNSLRERGVKIPALNWAMLSGANLTGANLSGADLSTANLSRTNLSTANLSTANLSTASLSGANLTEANLAEANLSEASLVGADLTGANLSAADLTGADLTGANLSGADLSGLNLTVADLTGVENLSGANLAGADLSGKDLSWMNLSGADLSGANLGRARVIRADLSGCQVENAIIFDTQFHELRGLPLPPSQLRVGRGKDQRVLTGYEAETFFTLPAIVEVFLTQVLTPRELAGYHLHFAEVLDKHAAPGVTDVGHRTEVGGTVLRFQGPNYQAIYAALPDLLAPFREAVTVDWEKSLAALPPDERVEAVAALVKREAGEARRRWELADRLAEVFAGFRNARVCRLSDGRSRGLRIDLFTNAEMAARLERASSNSTPRALNVSIRSDGPVILGDNTTMGDTFHNTGNITGAALGRGASVTAEQVIATIVQRAETAPAGDDLVAKLKEALRQLEAERLPDADKKEAAEDVGKVQDELAKPTPEPGRVRRLLDRIAAVSKSVADTLTSAKAITDLLKLGSGG